MKGMFYSVGVGPGDPELLTVKAVRVLEQCQVIAAPKTRSGQMLALEIAKGAANLAGKEILPLCFAMEGSPEQQKAAHQEAFLQICARLDAGLNVAMPNLGDVSIYATAGYLTELLQQAGYATRMIPGVPSFCAVAAALNTSLTEMDEPVHILPGGDDTLEEELGLKGTKILMKAGRRFEKVRATLQKNGLEASAAMVENCGLPGQQVYQSLEDCKTAPGYFATIIVKSK